MKRNILTLLTGMALGSLLTGGAVAAGVMAEPSWQNIYVDGRQVHMTAYNIGGNNFVKLRKGGGIYPLLAGRRSGRQHRPVYG